MTTTRQRCPGDDHQGSEGDHGGPGQEDSGPDDYPDFAEVAYQAIANLIHVCQMEHGSVPEPGTAAWFEADWMSQAASVAAAFLGELPGQPVVAEKAAAVAISGALNWSSASRNPTLATLTARRAVPGAMLRTVDPESAARWARTGSAEVAK